MGGERWRGTLFGTPHQGRWVMGDFRWIGVLLLPLAFCAAGSPLDSPHIVPVRVDHHVHLNSPAIQAFLPEFCASMRRFGQCDPALTSPHSVQNLLAEMDRAGIQRALVLSDGYLAESPMKPAAAARRGGSDASGK